MKTEQPPTPPPAYTHAEIIKMQRERIERLERTFQGIASCATQCTCCEMHRRLAVKALGYEVEITTDTLTV